MLIKKAIALIAAHPYIGRRTNIEGVRVKLVRDYLAFYEETRNEIFILSISDNRKNPEDMRYEGTLPKNNNQFP